MTDYIQVITTVEHKSDGETIAKLLLEKRLAACVQIVGQITSYFWWDKKIDRAGEYLCNIKTRSDLYTQVEKVITENHPYDVPEILALPIIEGGKEYLAWLRGELIPHK